MSLLKTPASVLIVEDDPATAELVKTALEHLRGFRVHVAPDASAALRVLRDQPADLLVFDVVLPGEMNGWELARAVRADPALSHVRLICITAWFGTADLRYARPPDIELDGLFAKPLDVPGLADAAHQAVTRPRRRP
ncbi:MAG: response regulator [Chloroflexi bacterium]|nr:response regulator [Chloroflexota bacterium]